LETSVRELQQVVRKQKVDGVIATRLQNLESEILLRTAFKFTRIEEAALHGFEKKARVAAARVASHINADRNAATRIERKYDLLLNRTRHAVVELRKREVNTTKSFHDTLRAESILVKSRNFSGDVLRDLRNRIAAENPMRENLETVIVTVDNGGTVVTCGGHYDLNAATVAAGVFLYIPISGSDVKIETCGSNYDTYLFRPCRNDDSHGCAAGGYSSYGARCTAHHLSEGFHMMGFYRSSGRRVTKLKITCF